MGCRTTAALGPRRIQPPWTFPGACKQRETSSFLSTKKAGHPVDGSRRDGKPNADGTYDCAIGLAVGMGVTIVQKDSSNLGPDVPMKIMQAEFSGDWCNIDPSAINDAFCDDYATCPRYWK